MSAISGFVGAALAIGSSHFLWTQSRKAQRRDMFADIAGIFIASAYQCLEFKFDSTVLRIEYSKYRKDPSLEKETVLQKQSEFLQSKRTTLDSEIQLESALARLRISSPPNYCQNYAHSLVRCLRNFPYDPEGMNGWTEAEFDRFRETIGGPWKINQLDSHPFAAYKLGGLRLLLNDFSIQLANYCDKADPVYCQPS